MRIRPLHSVRPVIPAPGRWACLLLAVLCSGAAVHAQCPFDRAAVAGEGSLLGSSVAADAGENVYMTGSFSDTVRFGDTSFHTQIGDIEVFLARFGRDLRLQWVRSIPGMRHAHRLAADADGNTYVAGRFATEALIGDDTARTRGDYDLLLVKYDPAGQPLWWAAGGGDGIDMPYDVAVGGDGAVYVAGRFSGTAWFGGESVTSQGGDDIFIAKYDSAGSPIWVRSAGGAGNDHGYALAVDSAGDVYITGLYQATATFGTTTLETEFNAGLFVAAYDRDGNSRWAWAPSGVYVGAGYGIAAGPAGRIYVTGDFDGTMEVGEEGTGTYGLTDIFLLALGSDGLPQWVRHGGGALHDRGNRVAIAGNGDIAITGGINEAGSDVVYFGDETVAVAGANIFVARYGPDGALRCITAAGGEQTESANGIAFGPSGDAYIAGSFNFYTTLGDLELEGNPSPNTSAYLAAVRYDAPTAVPVTYEDLRESPLSVAPNPARGAFTVRCALSGDLELRLMNMQGGEVWGRSERREGSGEIRVDAAGLPSGIYLLEAVQGASRWRRMVVIR